MLEAKVIGFPVRAGAATAASCVQVQHSLFPARDEGRGKVAFVDVGALDEERLFRLLALNAVTALVDLRPCPVFERPRFRHKSVVFHLRDRDIRYIEFAMLVRRPLADPTLVSMGVSNAYAKIEPALTMGLSICIYDTAARDLGWLDQMRRLLRHSSTYQAELHPRALAGVTG
ncbi:MULTISPECIES: hypothetical protein [Methylobacteriaceae]|uniref:Uncharacterized protein n=2 Tax=Methylobacterium TaxID=407 RepID=A0ABQ4SQ57_9HYPH|nr:MULTISPECIES: hypothetical protein [Methylobacterium]GBU15899.1 hypothetical protein AwMethylo_01140 [Methylobacterium sp.]GJE05354.1 hypothetical protein AOPFMNJM_0653 [Methylobacterium jeotgali]